MTSCATRFGFLIFLLQEVMPRLCRGVNAAQRSAGDAPASNISIDRIGDSRGHRPRPPKARQMSCTRYGYNVQFESVPF